MISLPSTRKIQKLVFLLSAITLLILLANWGYGKRVVEVEPFAVKCLEGWAHRGYVNLKKGYAENTIKSYQQAIDLGATGIEIDVLYDVEMNDFIVSHDKPYRRGEGGKVLMLEEAFKQLPPVNIWLDAKNLSSIWPWQAAQATQRLRELVFNAGRKEQVLVESRSPWYLRDLAEHGFKTALMISPNPKRNGISMWAMIFISKAYYSISGFSGISMGHSRYHVEVRDSFAEAPAYLSTINSLAQIEKFKRLPQVKVFLTDNPDLYGEHCSG